MARTEVAPWPDRPVRVLVADDHPLLREGLRQVLGLAGLQVVGEAANGRECLEKARSLRPDVVLMDLNMPEMSGLEATRTIKAELPGTRIVVLTIHDTEDYLVEAMQAGVEGYVLKDADPEVVVEAVRVCARGQSYLQPELGGRLMAGLRRREQQRAGGGARSVLSQREFEVLQLLAEGASNREISRRLFISEKTVKNHTNAIFRKMGVEDRTQAVLEAIRKGWVQVR